MSLVSDQLCLLFSAVARNARPWISEAALSDAACAGLRGSCASLADSCCGLLGACSCFAAKAGQSAVPLARFGYLSVKDALGCLQPCLWNGYAQSVRLPLNNQSLTALETLLLLALSGNWPRHPVSSPLKPLQAGHRRNLSPSSASSADNIALRGSSYVEHVNRQRKWLEDAASAATDLREMLDCVQSRRLDLMRAGRASLEDEAYKLLVDLKKALLLLQYTFLCGKLDSLNASPRSNSIGHEWLEWDWSELKSSAKKFKDTWEWLRYSLSSVAALSGNLDRVKLFIRNLDPGNIKKATQHDRNQSLSIAIRPQTAQQQPSLIDVLSPTDELAAATRGTTARLLQRASELDLTQNNLGCDGARVLKVLAEEGLPQLKRLNVGKNRLRRAGVVALCSIQSDTLEELDLSRNNIKSSTLTCDEMVHALTKVCRVKRLRLNDNQVVASKGFSRFAGALLANKTLKRLDLRDNEIGDEGMKVLFEGLQEEQELTELLLENNGFTDLGLGYVLSLMNSHGSLNVSTTTDSCSLMNTTKYTLTKLQLWLEPILLAFEFVSEPLQLLSFPFSLTLPWSSETTVSTPQSKYVWSSVQVRVFRERI